MPKILLILSVVFMLGSAVLGFLNKGKIDTAASGETSAKNSIAAANAEADKAKKAAKDTSEKLAAESSKIADMEQKVFTAEAEGTKATADVTNLTAQLTDKTAALDAANSELEKLKAAPVVPVEATPVVDNTAQVAELTAQIEALKSEKQIIGDKLVSAEAKTKELGTVVANAKSAVMSKGLEGQVIAVNQAWGFVVLNLGMHSGAVANAEMVVMRDGDRVGKVKITSVEPSNSIADIVATSVANGQRVLPGDRVIYGGN